MFDQVVPLTFGEKENLMWKSSLPGKAWSSPVITDGEVWATTAIEVFQSEQERIALLKAAGIEEKKFKQLAVAKTSQLKRFTLDFDSGELLSTIDLVEIKRPDPIHSLNSYASPTPVIDGDKIFLPLRDLWHFLRRSQQSPNRLAATVAAGPFGRPRKFTDD